MSGGKGNTEDVICVICKKVYTKRKKGYKGGRGLESRVVRGSNTITCCTKCSIQNSKNKNNEVRGRTLQRRKNKNGKL